MSERVTRLPAPDPRQWQGRSQVLGSGCFEGVLERVVDGAVEARSCGCHPPHQYAYQAAVCAKMRALELNERDEREQASSSRRVV